MSVALSVLSMWELLWPWWDLWLCLDLLWDSCPSLEADELILFNIWVLATSSLIKDWFFVKESTLCLWISSFDLSRTPSKWSSFFSLRISFFAYSVSFLRDLICFRIERACSSISEDYLCNLRPCIDRLGWLSFTCGLGYLKGLSSDTILV